MSHSRSLTLLFTGLAVMFGLAGGFLLLHAMTIWDSGEMTSSKYDATFYVVMFFAMISCFAAILAKGLEEDQ